MLTEISVRGQGIIMPNICAAKFKAVKIEILSSPFEPRQRLSHSTCEFLNVGWKKQWHILFDARHPRIQHLRLYN